MKDHTISNISPSFFGFNINWFGFQRSYWDEQQNKVVESITRSLKNDFSGAIYRYPGGSVANRFNWESSIGPVEERSSQKPVSWHKPVISKFGYEEFIDFVNSVHGKPWIVNNLYGDYDKEKKIGILSKNAENFVEYTLSRKQLIERWELGNELDRGKYRWPAEKYTTRAKKVGETIKSKDPNAVLVSMLRDYNVEGRGSGNEYNKILATNMAGFVNEFALHQYYDGPPGGPSIPNRLTHICSSIAEIKNEIKDDISIWITEHGRWPHTTKPINWKIEWLQTCNLESAISVADYMIANSKLPEVKGAFIHALSKHNGPWTLFHKVNGSIRPSLVYSSLRLLRNNMLPDVLDIAIQSKNVSNYFGNYDLRASVQTNPKQTEYKIWVVNRAKDEALTTLIIPKLSSQIRNGVMLSLFDDDLNKNNLHTTEELLPINSNKQLVFNNNGETIIKIPGQSISVLSIH
ncbi:MAG: hypothetical protein ABW098_15615 [Candidatus Thiodiazotropha sp.]